MPTIRPGMYRHFKGGLYEVIDVAIHSETLEPYAVYRELGKDGKLWVRPLDMFQEEIFCDGQPIKRFTYLGSQPGKKSDPEPA